MKTIKRPACEDSRGFFLEMLREGLSWDMVLVKVKVVQLCPTLCNPVDWGPPGASVHGILQARILKWVAIPFPRRASQPRNQTQVSCIAGRFF